MIKVNLHIMFMKHLQNAKIDDKTLCNFLFMESELFELFSFAFIPLSVKSIIKHDFNFFLFL
jgi:hypothetical protein